MGNKNLHKRKLDRTRDDTRQNEQRKEHYWRKKREHANIEERNDDNVNRDFQQQEVQPGMHAHMMMEHMTHIGTIFRKYRIQI
jgi:flagellar biosynthesis GTPase FlhF